MIQIYVTGNIYYRSTMDIETFADIMDDDFIKDRDFIKIPDADGTTDFLRKQSVICFNEESDNE